MSQDLQKQRKAFGLALAMGLELLVMVLVGVFAGYSLAGATISRELGAVIGSMIALVVWIWRLVKSQRHLQ